MLACKWLFLRVCGHLANARDRGNAKHFRRCAEPKNEKALFKFFTQNGLVTAKCVSGEGLGRGEKGEWKMRSS